MAITQIQPFGIDSANSYTFANVTATGNIFASGNVSATGNVIAGNITLGGNTISAAGNVSGGNILTAGFVSATGNITGGLISATGNIDAAGNLLADGYASVTGNITGGNIVTGTVRNNSGALTLSTSSGNINLSPTTGNIVINSTYINGVTNPVQNQDVATKIYVDNAVSTAISYHQPVVAATTTTLATTTGGTITYTQPGGAGNGVGALLTTTGSFNLIDTANVQTVGTRILVKNEGNAVFNGVYTWANATNIVRSSDTNTYGAGNVNSLGLNDYFFVSSGNVNAGSAWVVSAPTGTITFGTSNITFAQFSSSQTYTANTSAGISLIGTVINAKVDGVTTTFDVGGNISVKASANLTTPNIGAATGTSLSVTGAVNAATTISATGNITSVANIAGGNVLTAGIMSSTANAIHGNVLTAGLVSATANVTGGNLLTAGLITATGNIQGGNIRTVGLVSATGNVTGNYILGNGSQLTGLTSFVGATGASGITGNIGATGASGVTGNIGATGASGVTGNIGATGASGLGYFGLTSASSQTIASSGTFTLTTNLASTATAFTVGQRVRVFSTATPANFIEGTIATFSGTAMTVTISNSGGSGTIAAWTITAAGTQGLQGSTGASGLAGTTGATGASGVQGLTGATGASGLAGTTGATGASGVVGNNGATGNIGATGPSTAINATDDSSTTTLYPVMVGAAGSNQTPKVSTTKIYFNALTGTIYATSKSFSIPHPTLAGKRLVYGSLEGPENGVYMRGQLTNSDTIELPDYWTKLVDPDSITVTLTPIGRHQDLYVSSVDHNKVVVGNGNLINKNINCFFVVYGERIDIDKLVVESD